MKKGPLTKQDKTYIKKYLDKLTIDAMAHHLERGFKTVEKYALELIREREEAFEKEKEAAIEAGKDFIAEEPQPVKLTALDMMGRNKRYGAVTMTEAASMSADESLRVRGVKYGGKYRNCILVMNKNKDVE